MVLVRHYMQEKRFEILSLENQQKLAFKKGGL